MAIEFFFVPIDPVAPGGFGNTRFKVKYWDDDAVSSQGSQRYSWDTSALLMLDATQVYLDFVAAQSDTLRFCALEDLSERVGGPASNEIKNWLDPLGVPVNWVNANTSYREVLRGIFGMFKFTQVHEQLNEKGFFTDLTSPENGFSLNTQWQNLSQEFRDTMQLTIDHYGWPDVPAPNDQVRKILKDFSDKFEGTVMSVCGVWI